MAAPDLTLHALADAFSIATEYWDWQGRHVTVAPTTLVAVLAALGVDASTPESAGAALAEQEERPWRRVLPACRAVREGTAVTLPVHAPVGARIELWVELEDGQRRDIRPPVAGGSTRTVDGREIAELSLALPEHLPLGYHTLCARVGNESSRMALIVTPERLALPALLSRQGWGVAAQLYSVRSGQSWGIGDLADLEDLAVWAAAEHGADFVLVNPLHAGEPVPPLEPSPYLPTTRRFTNPLYLRLERIPEYATLGADLRERVAGLHAAASPAGSAKDVALPIDRDRAWTAKREALRLVFDSPRTPGRQLAFQAYRRREGRGLQDFATWSVLSEQQGAQVGAWPEQYRHPSSPAVQDFAAEHVREVEFQCWLQWLLDEQLAAAQQAGRRAGMALGVMHDLAVGVHPAGADAWSLQDDYARDITVGAPPDPYNQNGQNWSQPPWRPDRLAETAYAPFRSMVSTILRHAGGIRVDHVIGLFRLWWIPAGLGPTEGTYVRYDHDAMIGILALEAHRAEALVVGEDLGTVEPWVRDYLSDRGILGTSILWFEFDWEGDGKPLPPQRWRELCLASVTTHDLPPTAAYLAGDHVRLRERLGVLTRPLAQELAAASEERRAWSEALVEAGLMGHGANEAEMIEALHRFLTLTPSRLLCVALTDLVGDRQAQNQPGTTNEYPNWRVPLTGPAGEPLSLEDVLASPRAAGLAAVFER